MFSLCRFIIWKCDIQIRWAGNREIFYLIRVLYQGGFDDEFKFHHAVGN